MRTDVEDCLQEVPRAEQVNAKIGTPHSGALNSYAGRTLDFE